MCGLLGSCTDFKVIPTPFSEVIWNRYSSFYNNGKADHSIHCWPDVTPQIAFSSTGKVPNYNKNNSSIKPNKFHSKHVCFGGRKTREERKICLKICLFGFPQTLVYGLEATAACKVTLNSDWSIWIWARADSTTLYRKEEFCGKSLSFASLKPETLVSTTEDIFKHVQSEPQYFKM